MEIPLHKSCSLIKSHSCGLIAVDKAAGVLSHPNKGSDIINTLLSAGYDPVEEAYALENKKWFLLNRLDAPTSGVILLATNPDVAKSARKAFADHLVNKSYLAVVKGIPPRKNDIWRDCLEVDRKGNQLRTKAIRGNPNAQARMQIKRRGNGPPARAMIQLDPATGRTHQLRVQCASRKLPIIGDATYGDFEFNKTFRKITGSRRLLLHSWKTQIDFGVGNEFVSFVAESAVPGIFAIALR